MGAMSTPWKCDSGSALGMPPTSLISKPSLDWLSHRSRGFSRVYRCTLRAYSLMSSVLCPGKQLDSLDQACWVAHERVEVVGGIVVDEAEGYLDALGVDEIGAGGQGNAGHAGSCGRDRAQGAREVLDIFSRHHVGGVRRPHLVVQGLHELVIDGVRDLLHPCALSLYYARAAPSFVLAAQATSRAGEGFPAVERGLWPLWPRGLARVPWLPQREALLRHAVQGGLRLQHWHLLHVPRTLVGPAHCAHFFFAQIRAAALTPPTAAPPTLPSLVTHQRLFLDLFGGVNAPLTKATRVPTISSHLIWTET